MGAGSEPAVAATRKCVIDVKVSVPRTMASLTLTLRPLGDRGRQQADALILGLGGMYGLRCGVVRAASCPISGCTDAAAAARSRPPSAAAACKNRAGDTGRSSPAAESLASSGRVSRF